MHGLCLIHQGSLSKPSGDAQGGPVMCRGVFLGYKTTEGWGALQHSWSGDEWWSYPKGVTVLLNYPASTSFPAGFGLKA